jgi:predicted DNA-binding protein with PD1-like motif
MDVIVERLREGADLREELERMVEQHDIAAGSIGCGIGGLSKCRIRLPVLERSAPTYIDPGIVEITALQGTLSRHSVHAHISVADQAGKLWGGHLGKGCIVRLSCEVVLLRHSGFVFDRTLDEWTGYDELVVHQSE